MDTIKFGQFLKELRKAKGLTQEQLAQHLNVTNRTVSRWETGTNLPDIDVLILLSEFYNVSIEELLDGKRKDSEALHQQVHFLWKLADYSIGKEAGVIRHFFWIVVLGMIATWLTFLVTLKFVNSVTGGGAVLLLTVIGFLLYSIAMGIGMRDRKPQEYLIILIGGFGAVIVSNVMILCFFFFETGKYINYGLIAYLYLVLIVLASFVLAGLVTLFSKR